MPGEDAGDWVGAGEDEVREPKEREQSGFKDRKRDRDSHNPDRHFTHACTYTHYIILFALL